MSDYTPETDEVKHLYARAAQTYLDQRYADADAEFDRWLNAVLAEAWHEGYTQGARDHCDYSPTDECDIYSTNPYRPEATP